MKTTIMLMAVTGAIAWAYLGVRIACTVADVYLRWRDNDWEVER